MSTFESLSNIFIDVPLLVIEFEQVFIQGSWVGAGLDKALLVGGEGEVSCLQPSCWDPSAQTPVQRKVTVLK